MGLGLDDGGRAAATQVGNRREVRVDAWLGFGLGLGLCRKYNKLTSWRSGGCYQH